MACFRYKPSSNITQTLCAHRFLGAMLADRRRDLAGPCTVSVLDALRALLDSVRIYYIAYFLSITNKSSSNGSLSAEC